MRSTELLCRPPEHRPLAGSSMGRGPLVPQVDETSSVVSDKAAQSWRSNRTRALKAALAKEGSLNRSRCVFMSWLCPCFYFKVHQGQLPAVRTANHSLSVC